MIWTKDTPSTNLGLKYVLGEVKELFQALFFDRSIKNAIGELCDVYTTLMVALTTYTGLNLPIFWTKSAVEWERRLDFWNRYFGEMGLRFETRYIRNGGNYLKPAKRRIAVEMAIKEQIR